jgi:hypothetical protein
MSWELAEASVSAPLQNEKGRDSRGPFRVTSWGQERGTIPRRPASSRSDCAEASVPRPHADFCILALLAQAPSRTLAVRFRRNAEPPLSEQAASWLVALAD